MSRMTLTMFEKLSGRQFFLEKTSCSHHLFAQGHDTTAAAANWAVHLIGHHSDVQTRLHEEMDSIFGQCFVFVIPQCCFCWPQSQIPRRLLLFLPRIPGAKFQLFLADECSGKRVTLKWFCRLFCRWQWQTLFHGRHQQHELPQLRYQGKLSAFTSAIFLKLSFETIKNQESIHKSFIPLLQESLRLFPSVPFFARVLDEDLVIGKWQCLLRKKFF